MTVAAKQVVATAPKRASSKAIAEESSANEFMIAVVGHVGSGTSEVANRLQKVLEQDDSSGAFEVRILKARDAIKQWANTNGEVPTDE